jgi:hypothetical protein
LERIAIPLNHIIDDEASYHDVFHRCDNLKHVDLVGGVHETIAALHLEDWRFYMNKEIDAINQILLKHPLAGTRIWGGKAGRYESGLDLFFVESLTTNSSTAIY